MSGLYLQSLKIESANRKSSEEKSTMDFPEIRKSANHKDGMQINL